MKIIPFLLILFTLFCKESEKSYETNVEITRKDVVVYDNDKKPMVMDLEINYRDCPGNQVEVIRGGKEFANCINSTGKSLGDKIHIDIKWEWSDSGYYKWTVIKVDSCERVIDPFDGVSFDLVEECEDYLVYGNQIGFVCKKIPTDSLIKSCPWFRKK
jgi:hypothetical protein